jgi:hypothetical protein
MSTICERCRFEMKDGCGGTGTVVKVVSDDSFEQNVIVCPNFRRRQRIDNVKSRLTPEILKAPTILASPLFTPAKESGPPEADHTKSNVYITGVTWNGFLPHLRLALTCCCARDSAFTYKISDDRRVKEVFVGNEAFKNRTALERETKDINNAVADLVGKEFDLVILQLGHLRYKNIAAAPVLLEALMMRASLGKATWLFESSDPWWRWNMSKDPDIELYVDEHFSKLRLAGGDDSDHVGHLFNVDDEKDDGKTEQPDWTRPQEDEAPEIETPVETPRQGPPARALDIDSSLNFDMPGANRKKPFKPYNNKGWKR